MIHLACFMRMYAYRVFHAPSRNIIFCYFLTFSKLRNKDHRRGGFKRQERDALQLRKETIFRQVVTILIYL